MADSKITALTALTAADPVNDMFPVVDVSDTTMAASGTTKKISVNNILGASGTATLASATITGALAVDTTTLVANASGYADKVGIGTATPTGKLSLAVTPATADTDGLFIDGPSSRQMIAGITGATYSYLGIGANQVLLYASNGQLNIVGDAQNVRIANSASSFVTLDTSANFNVGAGNVVMATSGKGIDFSATASGSGTMTSELLNDYEEGTWTPTVIGSTTAGTGVYTTQVGKYTKIGNLVTVTAYISLTAHTGTGNLRLSGLPFANSSEANSFSAVAFGLVNNLALTAGNILTGYTSVGNVFIECNQTPTGGGASSAVPIDVLFDIIYTVTYRV